MTFVRKIATSFALAATFALPGHAAIMTYSTTDAYNAATTGNTTVQFAPDEVTPYLATYLGTSAKFGGITFGEAQGRLWLLANHYYGDNMGGNYLNNNSGGGIVTLTFDAPTTAFALNFGTIWNWGSAGSLTETFTFAGDSTSFTLPGHLASSSTSPSFLGFTSDVAFTSVTINDPTHGLAIRDVTYGSVAANDVPEPGSLALLAAGLLGVAAAYRRKQNG